MLSRGLTLGKFSPFHKGHQYVIETALKEVDELVVLIYASDLTTIPLQVRAEWIRKLYPQVTVIEGWDGPPGEGYTPEIMSEQENYIIQKLNGVKITHFYSSERYGEHVSQALGAIDRRVDPERSSVPVSATIIRNDPYSNRAYMDQVVYADMITRVCFLGAPSTGKTTIAQKMAEIHKTKWMPEYGREYWERNHVDRRIGLKEFEIIATEHLRREDAEIQQSHNCIFCDTCPITTYVFSKDYHGCASETMIRLARESQTRYDLFFLCDTDIPYDDTWGRSGDQKRQWFQQQIIGDLNERKLPYFTLRGNLEERISCVNGILQNFKRYMNPLDIIKI